MQEIGPYGPIFLYVKYSVYSVGVRIKWAFSKKLFIFFGSFQLHFFSFKNIIFEMRRHSQKYEERSVEV